MDFLKNTLLSALGMTLVGCAWLHLSPSTQHEAICKDLRFRISYVPLQMNGQTRGQTNAEVDQLRKAYHDQGCED